MIRVICGEVKGAKGNVRDIITDPEYLDITVPANRPFEHTVEHSHTASAYISEGEGYFDEKRYPYAFEVVGRNYFDFSQDSLIRPENLILFEDGDHLSIPRRQRSQVSPRLGKTYQRIGRVVRSEILAIRSTESSRES